MPPTAPEGAVAEGAAPPAIAGMVLGVLVTGLVIVAPCYLLMLRLLRLRADP